MAWGKIDDGLHKSAKWRRASKGGRALWSTALSWCMDELNDGNVPRDLLGYLDGSRADAAALVKCGLWHETGDGWVFHDWLDHQPSRAQVLEKRELTRERQRRWAEKKAENESGTNALVTRQKNVPNAAPDPTRPDPTPKAVGNLSNGGSPKQREAEKCPHGKPMGSNCGGCADARRTDDRAKVDAEVAKNRRDREAQAADAKQRKAENEWARAEAEANPDAVKAAAAQAILAARNGVKAKRTGGIK